MQCQHNPREYNHSEHSAQEVSFPCSNYFKSILTLLQVAGLIPANRNKDSPRSSGEKMSLMFLFPTIYTSETFPCCLHRANLKLCGDILIFQRLVCIHTVNPSCPLPTCTLWSTTNTNTSPNVGPSYYSPVSKQHWKQKIQLVISGEQLTCDALLLHMSIHAYIC